MPAEQRLGEEVDLDKRMELLVETTAYTVFNYVAQGLFERHKLILATQLCMAILRNKGEVNHAKFDFLLRGPKVGYTHTCPISTDHRHCPSCPPHLEWLSHATCASMSAY